MFGFVEPGPRPAPVAGGWLRSITPYLIMTNRSVDYLPTTGTLDPLNVNSTPIVGETLCGYVTGQIYS
jgi:hypothetical protein